MTVTRGFSQRPRSGGLESSRAEITGDAPYLRSGWRVGEHLAEDAPCLGNGDVRHHHADETARGQLPHAANQRRAGDEGRNA